MQQAPQARPAGPAVVTIEQVPLVEVRTAGGRKSRKNLGMSEVQLLAAVRRLARYRGFMTYHTRDSRGSEAGFPDLVMVSVKQRRVLFVELKTATGKTSAAQDAWLAALAAAGVEVHLWRPADLQTVIPAVLSDLPAAEACNAFARTNSKTPVRNRTETTK